MQTSITVTFTVEADTADAGKQMIAAFVEPFIRNTTGEQLPKIGDLYDADAVLEAGKAALRRVVMDAYLNDQSRLLEKQKAQQLATISEQATASMALAATFE